MNKYLSVLLILLCLVLLSCSSPAKDSKGRLWVEIEGLFPDEVDGIKKNYPSNGYGIGFINEEGKGISGIFIDKDGSITWVSDDGKNYDNGIPPSYAGWTAGTSYGSDDWLFIFYGTAPHYRDYYLNETKKWQNVKKVEINGFTVYEGTRKSDGLLMRYVDLDETFFMSAAWYPDENFDKFFDDLLKAIDVPTLRSLLAQ